MQKVYLNGKDFETIGQVHDYLAEELNFPEYYGKNLSALYDVLTEICEDTKISVNLEDMEDEVLCTQLRQLVYVMKDAADENDYLEVALKAAEENE